MTTYRVERRQRFTTVNRAAVNDHRLSFRARGVLVWLLDKPDDWRVDSVQIASATTEGRDAVRTALRELETLGYIERYRHHGERGRWVTECVVHEQPVDRSVDGVTGAGFPGVGQPGVGQPGANTRTVTDDCDPPTPRSQRAARRELRPYDVDPLDPEAVMLKYGVTA